MYSDLESYIYYQSIIPWKNNYDRNKMKCIMPKELETTICEYFKFVLHPLPVHKSIRKTKIAL